MSDTIASANNRFPSQARFILGNEAAERYSYYGMKGILALYITNVLMMSRDDATFIIHMFSFANYFMPILGAWVSDKFWGRYRTILWISLFYCAGHGVMALSDVVHTIDGKTMCLYIGLGLIAFGSGGIKPCVSAFMGDQFGTNQKHLLPKAYAAFYWCINLGSTAAFLTIPLVRKTAGYGWAFGIPGIAMAVATFVFWLGTKHYVMVPPASKTKSAGFFKVFWYAMVHRRDRGEKQKFWDPARLRFSDSEVDAARSVGPILMIFALAPVFWSLFDQTFSTWVLQGEMMKPKYFGAATLKADDIQDPGRFIRLLQSETNAPVPATVWNRFTPLTQAALLAPDTAEDVRQQTLADALNRSIGGENLYSAERFTTTNLSTEAQQILASEPTPETQSRLNRLLLEESFPDHIKPAYRVGPEEMLSANPILVMIFVPIMTLLVYPAIGRFATPLKRMATGMFLAAGSFVIVAWFQHRIDGGEQMSVLWQTLPYVVLTIAEVLFSTTGLEFAFREAAPSMKSIIMGFWTLTVAIGNLLVTGVTRVAGLVLGTGGGHDVSVSPRMFLFYAALTFVVAILFSIVTTFYRYRDPEAAQGR